MRHRVRELIVAGGIGVLIAVLVPLAGAQDISKGSIVGVVRDATSAVVADAEVTLSSAFGEKKTKTNGLGEYVFLNLNPGPDYAVTVQKQGFAMEKLAALTVALNQRITADVTLQVGATAQTVEVAAVGTATIDMASTSVGANLPEALYKNVAAGRNISSIVQFAPGVSDSMGAGAANPSINGASGLENQYVINGSNVTDSGYGGFGTYSRNFGALGNGVNFDFIQEVQVKSGGFEAQYGQALGGVVNVVTKAGTNNYHGSLYGYFQPQAFEATRPNPAAQRVSAGTFGYRENQANYDFGADIGGPIKKEKLFFYGGINPTFLRNYDLPDPRFANNVLGTQVLKLYTTNYVGKLNWNIGSKHSLEGTVFGDPAITNSSYWRGSDTLPAGRPPDNLTASKLDYGSRTWSGRYTGTMTPTWIVTANYSDHYNQFTETPLHDGYRITDNTAVQNGTGGSITYGGLGFLENYESKNHQFTVSSSHILNLGGSHSIDLGFDFLDLPYSDIRFYSGPDFQLPNVAAFKNAAGVTQNGAQLTRQYYQNNPANPIVIRMTRGEYSNPNVTVGSRYYAGFIQDAWNLGRHLTLKPGLRFEQQEMHGTSLRYVFAHNWAPRIGVIYDPTGQRKSKFFANWGRFYEQIPLDMAIRSFSFETSVSGTYYKDPGRGGQPDLSPANWCGAAGNPCGIGTGGIPAFSGTPDDLTLVSAGTGAEYQDEVVAGYEKEFGNKFTFSGRFVYRHIRRIIEDTSGINVTQNNAGVPQQYVIANPSATLDIFHNFFPCTSGPTCDPATNYTDLNQPILGADGIPDGFPNATRIYKSMELVMSRRFSNNLQLFVNYTLSKLYGDFQGSFRGDNAQTDPNISSLFDFTNTDGLLGDQYKTGLLPTNRTHQLKFFGNYQWKNANFGLSWRVVSGTPLSKYLDHPANTYANAGEVPVGGRGAFGTTATQFPLDAHVDYTWKPKERMTVKFLADMFDLFNSTWVQYVDQAYELSGSPGCTGHSPEPSGCTPNPDFLKPGGTNSNGQTRDAFTRPFYARLGIRFEF
jgi:Carboxypeptidase regulatory-like domain/TonB dependent receptor/TonB-dependent Receptor Plug Domain